MFLECDFLSFVKSLPLYVRSNPRFRLKFELLFVNFFQWSMTNNCEIDFLIKFVKFYGGLEVTFSQHDFYEVNPIIYLTYFLYNFYEVERVLFSILCLSTFIKSKEF